MPDSATPPSPSRAPDSAAHASDGNRLRLLPGGDETFRAVLADIEAAQTRVWLETYIFVPDAAGQQVLDALVRAARRGCDVLLLVDRVGAHKLRDRHVQPLRDAGGHAFWFNPFFGLKANARKVTPFGFHRDHRKILVVDDAVAYTGGRNVSMDYGGPGPEEFYDVMVRIEGPAARDFAEVFLETLEDTAHLHRDLFDAAPPAGDTPVRVLQLDLREKVGALDQAICELVAGSRERLLFCTPYLIPPRPILDELLKAARRGVDVRLLTCGKSDVPWIQYAGRHLYPRLLDAGVQIWEHGGNTLHAKFYVADGRHTIIGSYNADRWGQRYNQEVAAEVEGTPLADGLADCFETGCSRRITRETVEAWAWYARFVYWLLYTFSRLIAPDAPPDATRRKSAELEPAGEALAEPEPEAEADAEADTDACPAARVRA